MSENTKAACDLLAKGLQEHRLLNSEHEKSFRTKLNKEDWVKKFCQIQVTLPGGRGISSSSEKLMEETLKKCWMIHSNRWSQSAAQKTPKIQALSSNILDCKDMYSTKLNWNTCGSLIVNGWNEIEQQDKASIYKFAFEASEMNSEFVLFCFNKIDK